MARSRYILYGLRVSDCGVIVIVTLNDVLRALDGEEIAPFFQPVVELRTGRLCGFEVLARWLHPEHGPILPENFIRLAEESGSIARLTQQIMKRTFASVGAVPESLFVAINVSPGELCTGELGQMVRDAADRAGFRLDRLILEVTESGLIEDYKCALDTAVELREMGCRLALDDFGTGHSSLSHLRELPFYGLKIDRSFVEHMVRQRESRKIVASVIGLSTSLRMKSVAEGVETEEDAEMLLWLGCDMGQGWLYGRPGPADELPHVIAASYRSARFDKEVLDDGLHAQPAQYLAQLQAIYKCVPVGLCFLDLHERYVSLNQRYADYVGKPKSAFIGATVKQMNPEVYEVLQPLIARAFQGESIVNEEVFRPPVESRRVARTGLVSYEPARDEAGEIIGASVSVLDISDRDLGEPHSKDWLPPYSEEDDPDGEEESSPMPWVRDANGNLIEVSPRWLALTGMKEEQALNLGWLEAVHPEDRGRALGALREAIRTRAAIDVTYRAKTRDGDVRWLRARGYPRYNHVGGFLGWYGGTEDVDEKRLLERALYEQQRS